MRILLFIGKGGVGKTTLAAATAAGLAQRGRKTLVVSTDPAHSLGDALAIELGGDPVDVDDCLQGVQVEARELTDRAWNVLREQLRSALTGMGVDRLEAEELTVLPAVDELLALTEVQRLAENGPWENVIVDCGPTAETLRLLALPEAVSGYLRRMHPSTFAAGTLQSIDRLAAHLESLRRLLTDATVTTARLVLTPQRLVVAETRRMLTSLALRGLRVDGVVVNRLLPAPGMWRGAAATWLRTRRAQQDEILTELRRSGLVGGMLRSVEHRAHEPIGVSALQDMARELYGDTSPLIDTADTAPLLEVDEVDGGFTLRVVLPLDQDSTVDLARVDDDLAITVDGFRRLVSLPETLQSCRLISAESDARGLLVHLEPNS